LLAYRDQGRSIKELVEYRTKTTPGWKEAAKQTEIGRNRENELEQRQAMFDMKEKSMQQVR